MHGATHGGKGSAQRPTDKKKYADNWDNIFGNKDKKKKEDKKDDRQTS